MCRYSLADIVWFISLELLLTVPTFSNKPVLTNQVPVFLSSTKCPPKLLHYFAVSISDDVSFSFSSGLTEMVLGNTTYILLNDLLSLLLPILWAGKPNILSCPDNKTAAHTSPDSFLNSSLSIRGPNTNGVNSPSNNMHAILQTQRLLTHTNGLHENKFHLPGRVLQLGLIPL